MDEREAGRDLGQFLCELNYKSSYEPSYESNYELSYKSSFRSMNWASDLWIKLWIELCRVAALSPAQFCVRPEGGFRTSCEPNLLHSRATVFPDLFALRNISSIQLNASSNFTTDFKGSNSQFKSIRTYQRLWLPVSKVWVYGIEGNYLIWCSATCLPVRDKWSWIFGAYSQKVVRTNEIVRSVIIT